MEEPIKPLSVIIQEDKKKIADVINDCKLPAYLLEPIIRELYDQVIDLKNNEYRKEKKEYEQKIAEINKKIIKNK